MLQQITLLMIVAMVCLACSILWAKEPVETLKNAQETRIQKAAVLTFH
jgi:hypothetical protein